MDVKRAYLETAEEAEKRGWEIGSLASFYRKWNEIPETVRVLTSNRCDYSWLESPGANTVKLRDALDSSLRSYGNS